MMAFHNNHVWTWCDDRIWYGDHKNRLHRANSVGVLNCLDGASRGHLFKLVPTEWDTAQDAICKSKQGSHMQEWQCHQLRLAHGLHVPE